MNGAERINAIMKRENKNELSWTTLVDSATLEGLPESMSNFSTFDFYRHVGCDILLLNGWTGY